MWMLVSLTTIAASFALLRVKLRAFGDDRLSQAFFLLIWFRFALTALGPIGTRQIAAGQSLLALGTLAAVVAALMVLPLDRLRTRPLLPFLGLAGVVFVSGILNSRISDLVNAMILWILFVVLSLLAHRALQRHGMQTVLGCLLAVFALPIGLQLIGVALGQSIVGQDGTIAYVGNYAHEAVFSTVALAAIWLVTIYPWEKRSWLVIAFALVLVSMVMANYRTLILACLPFFIAVIMRFAAPKDQTKRSGLPAILGLVALLGIIPVLSSERFAELTTAFGEVGELVKPPQEFSAVEKDILSARVYIAAAYVQRFMDGGTLQHLVGYGPGARVGYIETHPHNEYLRVLYESGVVGLGLWLLILISHIVMSLRLQPAPARILALSGYAGLVIGSLGTSFFNRPEGAIFVALLCATTWHLSQSRNPQRHSGAFGPQGREVSS